MKFRINFWRKIEVNLRLRFFGNMEMERKILEKLCQGRGADIGCGSSKITSGCIGVDLTGHGQLGKLGCEKNQKSVADIKASGDSLSMFNNDELDYIVAKHNLEHYRNPLNTLLEWKRVVRRGGKIGVVVPDDRYVNTMALDPTHYSAFTPTILRELFFQAGIEVLEEGTAVKHWSIFLIGCKG